MNTELLAQTSNLSIHYDKANSWLYLDWYGDLTLCLVQENCLLAAQCFLMQKCSRVLNDNTNVTSITSDVGIWLANDYLPHIEAAGVEYMAWVHSSNIDTQSCTDVALSDLLVPVVALFNDLASAYSWLCVVKFKAPVFIIPPTKKVYRHQQEIRSHVLVPSPLYIH